MNGDLKKFFFTFFFVIFFVSKFNYSVEQENPTIENSSELGLKPTYGKNELQIPPGPQYIVIIKWFNKKGHFWEKHLGTIIHEEIVLTGVLPHIKNAKQGVCILTHDLAASGHENMINWKGLKYYEEKDPQKKTESFALIKLEEKINLGGGQFIALDINFGFKPKPNRYKMASIFSLTADDKIVYSGVNYTIRQNTSCDKYGECIEAYFRDKSMCERIVPKVFGSPVLREGKLIGTVRKTITNCTKEFPTNYTFAMNPVYSHKDWIELSIEELFQGPPRIYSEYSKYMVFYGYQKGEDTVFHAAAVLDNSVVITNYAQCLNDDVTDAFVVYGTPNITNLVVWPVDRFRCIFPASQLVERSSDLLPIHLLSVGMVNLSSPNPSMENKLQDLTHHVASKMSSVSVDDSAATTNDISMKSTSANSSEFVASTSLPSHCVLIYGTFRDLSSNAVTKE
uniref:Peptidase S1 domain-containing protein n=1 Tax=Glossina pallidipes TaxID=7398 RepID=A0A1B0ACT4_GLOPL